jgi:LuxR family maltose regulon positive regulatory protein
VTSADAEQVAPSERERRCAGAGGHWHVGNISPPTPLPSEILREELLAQLERSLTHKVTLITGCAGYGKTTLAAQWYRRLHGRGLECIWLTFNNQSSAHQWGADLEQIIAEPGDRVVILDDYNRTPSDDIDRVLARLIAHLPDNRHLILICRTRPSLSLAALRARSQLLTFEASQLRLSDAEARLLFPAEVGDHDVQTLVQRTEGWPVALQLARAWLDTGTATAKSAAQFNANLVHLADYLTEEVLAGLPDCSQSLLLKTSILERVNGDLVPVPARLLSRSSARRPGVLVQVPPPIRGISTRTSETSDGE